MAALAWLCAGHPGTASHRAEVVQPLLMLEGRSYAIVSLEPPFAGVPPVMVLRDEVSGRLERRWALIQLRLEDNVTLDEVLADLPVGASPQATAGTYVLHVSPDAFSRVHRTLLTDWRVARLEVPLADQQGTHLMR
jgi:hypothetical protein